MLDVFYRPMGVMVLPMRKHKLFMLLLLGGKWKGRMRRRKREIDKEVPYMVI